MLTPQEIDDVRRLGADGVDQWEIARRMGMSLNTLKRRLRRSGYRLVGGTHVLPLGESCLPATTK